MATKTLPHCQKIGLGVLGPCVLTVSSTATSGTVTVSGPGGVPPLGVLDLAIEPSLGVPIPPGLDVYLHYEKDGDGPEQIEVDWSMSS